MAVSVTLTWTAPSDATDAHTDWKITRTVRGVSTTLAATQSNSGGPSSQQTYADSYTPSPSNLKVWTYQIFRAEDTDPTNFSPASEIVFAYPTLPSTTDKCTVYGIVEGTDGNPVSGLTVTAVLNESTTFNALGEQVMHVQHETTTDADGYFEFELYRQSKLVNPSGTYYTVAIENGLTLEVNVPDQYAANVADLA